MALPQLEFEQTWTADTGSEKYIKTKEPDEEQARKDLQIQHDNTADWALSLVEALGNPENLGIGEHYSEIGTGLTNVKEALVELESQIVEISQEGVANYSITTAKLSGTDGQGTPAVTAANIADGAVTTAKLSSLSGAEAVTTEVIRSGAITSEKLASGSGANAAVAYTNIQTGAVRTSHIYDGAVTNEKLDASAVQNANIADATIQPGKFNSAVYGTTATALAASASAGSAATVSRSDHAHPYPAIADCTGTLAVAKGGTGATTAAGARTALGSVVFKSQSNVDFSEEETPTLTDYPYKATITDADIGSTDKVYVEFDAAQIGAGTYSPLVLSEEGKFYIFADTEATSQTIHYTILRQ